MKITIDRYEPCLEGLEVVYYAVKGDRRYKMPSAFKDMYDNEHLAIMSADYERPEVLGLTDSHNYIPLYTGASA